MERSCHGANEGSTDDDLVDDVRAVDGTFRFDDDLNLFVDIVVDGCS